MYDTLRYNYEPKLVNDWYDYSIVVARAAVSEDAVSLLFFKHLVAIHGYTTPEQLLADCKKDRERMKNIPTFQSSKQKRKHS